MDSLDKQVMGDEHWGLCKQVMWLVEKGNSDGLYKQIMWPWEKIILKQKPPEKNYQKRKFWWLGKQVM
jgi:hypothetical protein